MNENGINCAVIFYSQTGNVLEMAEAAAAAAREAGAELRLGRVAELAPDDVIARHEGWSATQEAMASIPLAGLADLEWADAVFFGSPTRYGLVSSQLKQFIDMTGPLWQEGKLAGKVYSAFTSAATLHGGHESTLLSLSHVFHHWGGSSLRPVTPIQSSSRPETRMGHPITAAPGGRPPLRSKRSVTRFAMHCRSLAP